MISVKRDQAAIEAREAADLATAKARAIAGINARAGQQRLALITDLPGQDMIYLAKEAEALRYLAETPEPADLSSYPLIAAEVGITAPDAYQIAQIWAQLGAMWRQVAAQIEGARLGAINAITAAEDDAAIRSAIAFTEQP